MRHSTLAKAAGFNLLASAQAGAFVKGWCQPSQECYTRTSACSTVVHTVLTVLPPLLILHADTQMN